MKEIIDYRPESKTFIQEKGDFRKHKSNFIFSSTGQRPAGLCHGLAFVVHPSVSTFILNIFSKTTQQILMKFHRNDPVVIQNTVRHIC